MLEPMGSAPGKSARRIGLIALALCLLAPLARADDTVGGHFGVVFPLITRADGDTTNIGDDFKIGFPMGITVKKSDHWAFDLELVPVLDPREEDEPLRVSLTVHPGVLRDLGGHWTAGLRMAFDIGGASWGFTPLLSKGFSSGDHAPFVEFQVPIRFQDDVRGERSTAIGFGVHVGVGF